VQLLLGHSQIATTALYLHLTEPTRTSLTNLLDKLMVDPRSAAMIEVADVFRRFVEDYLNAHGATMPPSHRRTIADILACRTPRDPVSGAHRVPSIFSTFTSPSRRK
jgi:hypothetical protein